MKDKKIVNKEPLIIFDRKHIILIGLLLLFFLLTLTFKLHGYSISMWHAYIDGSKPEEILVGSPQPIRSDDWLVELPLMLSQSKHDPKFPMVNQNIGNGANMLTHSKVPIYHYLSFFRPTVWGFFIGDDFGLAWMWHSMVLGLFYVFFLVLMIISENDFFLSITGSLLLVFAPFFQIWSFHKAEIPIFMGLIFVTFSYMCFSQKRMYILFNAFLLGWSLSCFTINFVYPAFQVSCGYLLLFLMVGILIQRFEDVDIKKYLTCRILGCIVSVSIFAAVFFSYLDTGKDIIDIMKHTTYPGQRFCTGGDYSFGNLFRQNFLSFFIPFTSFRHIDWGTFANPCEASSFPFFFIPVSIGFLWQIIKKKSPINWYSILIMGYLILTIVYLKVGFPDILSKFSLFYLVPSNRMIMGVGIAEVLLLVLFFKNSIQLNQFERLGISFVFGVGLLASGRFVANAMSQISLSFIVAISALNALICYFLIDIRRKKQVMAVLIVVTILTTIKFNPIVFGGTQFITENKLSKKIIEIDKSLDGKTVWAGFGPWVYPNLFKMLGVRSINGTHPHPQLDMWRQFDPQNQFFDIYNRYANVAFEGAQIQGVKFQLPSPDLLVVSFNPNSGVSDSLGITHFLVIGQEEKYFEHSKRFKKLFALNDKSIYKLIPAEASLKSN